MANGNSQTLQHESIIEQAVEAGKLSTEAFENLSKWLGEPQYSDFRNEIVHLIDAGKWDELNDSFYTLIPFGTGGRRGPVGVGPNRINRRTIGESTQGLSKYIGRLGEEATERGVVIAYDTRHYSREFAEETARVLAGNGIKAYLFDGFRPTPELSFAVRYLNAQAGVVISASHNPPSDNGYKVYWDDGGQIVSPHDAEIIAEVKNVTEIRRMDFDRARELHLFEEIGEEIDNAFFDAVLAQSLTSNRDVKILYSPLHGTGVKTVVPVLKKAGFNDLHILDEQASPDPDFSNVPDRKPNPEEKKALDLLMQRAAEMGVDIAFATDPDADRLGCAIPVPTPDGTIQWQKLTGNQVACMLCRFILSQLRAQNRMPEHAVVVRTIVTTEALDAIAADFGAEIVNHLLVGFKYIGEVIHKLPEGKQFVFGAEESLGYLSGTYARDKDAAVAALILAELAATLKAEGRRVIDYLNDIYRSYGYYSETLGGIYLYGQQGSEQIKHIMSELRTNTPAEIAGRKVERITDRQTLRELNLLTGEERGGVEGIPGNVLLLHLDGGARIGVRPSGTEPKAKFYVSIRSDVPRDISDEELYKLKENTDRRTAQLLEEFERMAREIAEE